jgi:uncharacterized protein (DUF2141 family)
MIVSVGQPALLTLILLLVQAPSFAQQSELRIEVAHPVAKNAEVRVGLYTNPSNWLDDEPVYARIVAATDTLTTVVFGELPPGTYGAAVYLDENRNGKLDRNLIGFFKEPFGFSKEARVRFGPPKWDDAIFVLDNAPVRLFIRLD